MKPRIFIVFLVNLGWFMNACAPLFSDMQSARLVGENQWEITPGYTAIGLPEEKGEAGGSVNYLGLQGAYGFSDRVDLRFRFEHASFKEPQEIDGDNFIVLGFGPKISLVKDRVALFLPIHSDLGPIFQFLPTFLFSIPVNQNKIEFNPSVKHIINFCSGCWQPLVAFNMGAGFSSDLSKWAIRPEYGMLYNLEDEGHYRHFSIGLSFNISVFSRRN